MITTIEGVAEEEQDGEEDSFFLRNKYQVKRTKTKTGEREKQELEEGKGYEKNLKQRNCLKQ